MKEALSMKGIALRTWSSLFLIFVGLGVSSEAEACLEKPKSLKLSETTFENDVEISYGLNCRVSLTIEAKDGNRYSLRHGSEEGNRDKLCLTVVKANDLQNKKEYCGEDLETLSSRNKNALALRNKAGEAVGAIDIKGNAIRILSWDAGGNPAKPHLQFQIEDVVKSWKVLAMQNESTQVGGGSFDAGPCTRSLGGEKNSGNAFDLRGKQISTTGTGCTAGMVASEYGASAESSRKPILQMEGTTR